MNTKLYAFDLESNPGVEVTEDEAAERSMDGQMITTVELVTDSHFKMTAECWWSDEGKFEMEVNMVSLKGALAMFAAAIRVDTQDMDME